MVNQKQTRNQGKPDGEQQKTAVQENLGRDREEQTGQVFTRVKEGGGGGLWGFPA